jgi:hypothetical protein
MDVVVNEELKRPAANGAFDCCAARCNCHKADAFVLHFVFTGSCFDYPPLSGSSHNYRPNTLLKGSPVKLASAGNELDVLKAAISDDEDGR